MRRMVWYPSVDDVIDMNVAALDLSRNKHPHKLRVSRSAVEAVIVEVKKSENEGLTYQAAMLMLNLVRLHPFDGGNHRTAYGIAKMFLRRNGKRFKLGGLAAAYAFIKNVEDKSIREVQRWIEHATTQEPE